MYQITLDMLWVGLTVVNTSKLVDWTKQDMLKVTAEF